MKKIIALFLTLIMVAGIFTACGGGGETAEAPLPDDTGVATEGSAATEDYSETGVLTLPWTSVATDDMVQSPYMDWQGFMQDLLWDSLIKYELGSNTNIINRLASDWSVSDDGLVYTFTIRDDANWHDGQPVTAEDFKFSFELLIKGALSTATWYNSIDGFQAFQDGEIDNLPGVSADGKTLTLTLSQPNALFPKVLCRFVAFPKHLLEGVDPIDFNNHEYFKAPIGNGPYKFESADYPNFIILTRNDDYYGPKAGIKTVKYQNFSIGGVEAIAAAMIAGEVDFGMRNELNDIHFANNVVSKNPDFEYLVVDSLYTRFFTFNVAGSQDGRHSTDIRNPRVRQALNMLIDKDAVASFYGEQGEAMTSYVPANSPFYNTDIPLFKRDVEGGKAILEEEGFDFNHTLRITTHYTDQTTADIMDLIIQNFAEAGVKAEFAVISGDAFAYIYENRNYDILYGANSNQLPIEQYRIFVPGQVYDMYLADVDIRQELFGDPVAAYLASDNEAEQKEIITQLQATHMEFAQYLALYRMNNIVTYNASRFYFDPAFLDFELSLVGFSDLGLEHWRLLQP